MGQKKSKNNRKLIKNLIPYYKPYINILLCDLFCALILIAVELSFPMLVKQLVDEGIYNSVGIDLYYIFSLAGVLLALKICDFFASYFVNKFGHIMGARMEADMRLKLFTHLQYMPHIFYDNSKTGQLMSRLSVDLFDIAEFAHHCPEEFFIAVIKILGSFCILMTVNIPLTLMIFACLPFVLWFSLHYNKKMNKVSRNSRIQIGEINAKAQDSLEGHSVVKSFTNEEKECDIFQENNIKLLELKKKKYNTMGVFFSGSRFLSSLLYVIGIVASSIFMYYEKIVIGDVLAYILYIEILTESIRKIVEYSEQYQLGITGFERYQQIIAIEPSIIDSEDAIDAGKLYGNIKFEDICLKYSLNGEEVFNGINFSIDSDQNIAFVGGSGAGKSSICNLIPRFYEPTSGNIYIDGKNIKDFTLKSLRKNIGIVQQNIYLFSGTIADNIAYGKPGATIDEIKDAAKKAGISDFVEGLTKGYQTYVGEKGVKLSGGQKQRISIARVFLKNPSILILDEATSSLDNNSEKLINESFAELSRGRTTIRVAHRLSTIIDSDKIFVLDKGNGIVECGTHAELMEKKGVYFHLYNASNTF